MSDWLTPNTLNLLTKGLWLTIILTLITSVLSLGIGISIGSLRLWGKGGAGSIATLYQLFPFMSAADNIAFGLKVQKLDKTTVARKIEEALAMVQMSGYHQRMPDQLSGGERQRVALARTLILKPRLLLLDEPLSNLDAGLREELHHVVRHLQKETGVTMIFVTHDQTEAVAIADRIALMLDGQLKQVDAPGNFFERPIDIDVAKSFGGVKNSIWLLPRR